MKRSTLVNYLEVNGRYDEQSPKPYSVRFPSPFGGKFFCSADTGDLVDKMEKFCRTKEGRELLKGKDLSHFEDKYFLRNSGDDEDDE